MEYGATSFDSIERRSESEYIRCEDGKDTYVKE